MAQDTQNIGDLIRKLVENNEEVYSLPCEVVEVSGSLAELAPLNGDANLLNVKLIAGTSTTPLLITPTKGSVVIATFLSKDTAFIGLYSEIDTIELRGNQYGGLIKIEDLVGKLNDIENKVNGLITKFNSHTHLYAPGPSAPIPTAPTVTPETPITPITLKTDLENDKINHG
jgi:hypothetical protein